MTIFIFGTVCIDKVRSIDEFPNKLGTYTNVNEEHILLGGEASNTFMCLIKLIKENIGDSNDDYSNSIKLVSVPIVNDNNGKIIMNFLKEYESNVIYNKIVEPLDSSDEICPFKIKYTPSTDIYVCKNKERTMFGIGFPQVDLYLSNNKNLNFKLLNQDLKFGIENWITIDCNHPLINYQVLKKSIKTNTNLYIMDQNLQELNLFIEDGIEDQDELEQYKGSLIFQSSSDHIGNKNDEPIKFLKIMNDWFKKCNGKFKKFLFILTDSKNGFAIGGTWKNNWIEPYWFKPTEIPSEHIIDTTGAGDAFRAALLYSLIYKNSSSLSDALEFASACGGLNCCSFGGSSLTPSLNSINNFLKSNNKNQIN